jgi:alanine racemase
MSRPTYLKIDLSALHHNFKQIQAIAPKQRIIAMVKANAYGHGIVQISHGLPKADAFGVASLDEGIKLREAGIDKPIILMEGVFSIEELQEAAQYNFTLVVHHLGHIEMLENSLVNKGFDVWLKIDTGMHRLGIAPQDVVTLYARLQKISRVNQPIGLMTHMACADDIRATMTTEQIDCFNTTTAHLGGPYSLANSASILAWPSSHGDWVRPGLILYGASPFMGETGLSRGLKPVMTLWSRLISITSIKQGDRVGYGGDWQAPKDTLIGVVGVGYGDGYPQKARNGTPLLVNGVRCPLVGRVSMDMLTVDLTNQPHAKIGDPVILWGMGLPVEEISLFANSTPYEILTRMTPRPKVEIVSN